MPDQTFNWQRMEFPMESSPRSAGPRLQPAHHVQMRPVAPRLQVSNFQFTEGNAASTYGAPALNRGFSANPAFVPFEANNRNSYPLHQPTTLAFPMQRNASIHSEPGMPLQGPHGHGQGAMALASTYHPQSIEGLSVAPFDGVNENSLSLISPNIGLNPGTYLSTTGTNLSPDDMPLSDMPSAPPSMVSASSVGDLPYPMTREGSHVQASPSFMHRMPSFSSFKEEPHFGQGASDYSQPNSPWKPSNLDTDLFAIGNGITSSLFKQYDALENQSPPFPSSASMERETSNISIKSTKSTASNLERRFKAATERVIQTSKDTVIAPMPQPLPPNTATSFILGEGRTLQEDNKNKPKSKPPKLCPHCNEYPNGFRGDHELRRHTKAKHRSIVKKWRCRDPTKFGIFTELRTLYSLSKCKACASGKLYGAYYNAAAHLRRTHFTVKPTRARGGSSNRNGGRGGGDWPAMKHLKLWFEEVTVEGDGSDSLGTAAESSDKCSPSHRVGEAELIPDTQMPDAVGQLKDTDTYNDFFSPDLASMDIIPAGYLAQSSQAASGLNMMVSGLNDNDIVMDSSSQDSILASDLQDMDFLPYGQCINHTENEGKIPYDLFIPDMSYSASSHE
ncbi:uncharacterized protein TrAFT101_010943 [Trichoderma asperellum]|uniref:uncharacterized protein n=1 Tax=Trichoderma asperellum TaxID=101201 RepID=UPI00332D9FE8|nr:hypothetical protein TrAFT101_010943 [Trichoderma asperellum]